jgi:hypothetical protein
MPLYEQTPGSLNLSFVRGDDFTTPVDFSISMAGYQVSAEIISSVSGAEVAAGAKIQDFTITIVNAATGQYNLSLTDQQTAAIPRGTYAWRMKWTEGSETRTALSGFVEVL